MEVLAGKTAVVTGAASGIGLALARRLGAEGMRVVLADVEAPALERGAAELAAAGVRCLAVRTDVSRAEEVEALAACRGYEAAGVDLLLCLVNPYKIPHDKVMQTIELMGAHVIPKFR